VFISRLLPAIDTYAAGEKARTGDLDGAIELSRTVVEGFVRSGEMFTRGVAAAALVELRLSRGGAADLLQARTVIDRAEAMD
jgi:adenylate cyclase